MEETAPRSQVDDATVAIYAGAFMILAPMMQ
jgi:hypothetical protein